MAGIDSQTIQKLLDDLDALKQRASTTQGKATLNATEATTLAADALKTVPLDATGKFDPAEWDKRPEDERLARYQNLTRFLRALSTLLEADGPADKGSIMFREYLSNSWVVFLTLLGLIGTILTLWFIHRYFNEATRMDAATMPPSEEHVLRMVILMGVLGGFLHLTSSLGKYVGNRDLLRSWVIYYFLMPVEGAALAVAVYLLMRVGVLSPSTGNQPSTGNLNFVGIYGFSLLAGLFAKQALEMLGNLFNTIFAKVQAKDQTVDSKPKTDSAAASPSKPAS